uniref:hypothetical protein n=1 Tax=Tetragenococcus solitarius TaxID=71453 RepID=UPI001C3F4AC4
HSFSESYLKPYSEAIISHILQHPLGVQKEPQSVMVKVTKLNHERGSLNGYITGKTDKFQS